MTRRSQFTAGALAFAALLASSSRAQQTVFRAETSVVTVDVSVKRGKAMITNLKAEDFVLIDNGVRQTVALAGANEVRLDVTLVLDHSYHGSMLIGDRWRPVVSEEDRQVQRSDDENVMDGWPAIRTHETRRAWPSAPRGRRRHPNRR